MSESSSWQTLRKYLIVGLPDCDIQRIEDKLTTGVPDTNVCFQGREFWLEGKALRELPARGSTAVRPGLRVDQYNWLVARQNAGGNAFVWLRVNNVGWWLFTSPEEFFKLRAEYDDYYTKDDLLSMIYFKTCKELVDEIRRKIR